MARFLEEKINEIDNVIVKLEKEGVDPYESGVTKLRKQLDQSLGTVKISLSGVKAKTDELKNQLDNHGNIPLIKEFLPYFNIKLLI